MAEEVKLMKGNEAIAHAAIRYGVDGYFGYPITPQSEILETLMAEMPWEKTGMVVLQAESEVAAINMVYGGAGTGKKVMTSSSSPGVSLKQEGISYEVKSSGGIPLFCPAADWLCSCTGRADRHLAFGIRGSQPGCSKFLSALRQFLSFSPLQKLLL